MHAGNNVTITPGYDMVGLEVRFFNPSHSSISQLMSKRANKRTKYVHIPSLQSLALAAVRRYAQHPSEVHLRRSLLGSIMDTDMSSSTSTGTQTGNKRSRTDAQDGAEEVGSGLEVTRPPRAIPHLYNNNYTVRLSYADNYRHEVKCDGSTAYSQLWRANSIFDPDYTGVGHQPICRDMWASMYGYYAVLACKYTIRLYNAAWDSQSWTSIGTSGQRPTAVNVSFLRSTLAADFTTYGTIYPQAEMKNCTTMFLTPDNTVEITGTVTPGDFLVDATDADSDQTWTQMGSNPTVPRFIGYVITPAQYNSLTGVNETPYAVIQAQVILEYTVQFTRVDASLRGISS